MTDSWHFESGRVHRFYFNSETSDAAYQISDTSTLSDNSVVKQLERSDLGTDFLYFHFDVLVASGLVLFMFDLLIYQTLSRHLGDKFFVLSTSDKRLRGNRPRTHLHIAIIWRVVNHQDLLRLITLIIYK